MVQPKSPFPTTASSTPSSSTPNTNPGPQTPFGRPGGDDDFIIDMSGVDLTSNLVPEGRHLAFISDVEKSTSKAGNPMIVWSVTMYGGDAAGKTLKTYTALSPNAMWKVYEICEAVGFQLPDNKQIRLGELKAHALRTLVMADVTIADYNGRPSSSLSALYPPDGQEAGSKIPSAGVPQ